MNNAKITKKETIPLPPIPRVILILYQMIEKKDRRLREFIIYFLEA
jgi:hypothetical protein